jgi:hypothetical protein
MSDGFKIDVTRPKKLELVRIGLQNLDGEVIQIGRLPLYKTCQAIVRRVKIYPPPRPNQKYIRTFNLRDSWEILHYQERGYRIRNAARKPGGGYYPTYVVGDSYGKRQAWMHVGRWFVARDVVEEEVGKLPAEISKHIMVWTKKKDVTQ